MERAVCEFLAEATRLSGRNFYLKNGKRFVSLMFKYAETEPWEYIYARIEVTSGDIYSQTGKKAVGNIFTSEYRGKEFIDKYGVIVNRQKLAKRLKELKDTH